MDHEFMRSWTMHVILLAMFAAAYIYMNVILEEIYEEEEEEDGMDFQLQSPASVGNMPSGIGVPTPSASLPGNAGPSRKRSRAVEVVSAFNEIFARNMSVIAKKLPDPPKGGLVKEVKTLGFTRKEEMKVLLKLADNPQYERIFWELDDTPLRVAFLRRILE